jgi:hypothetical protein
MRLSSCTVHGSALRREGFFEEAEGEEESLASGASPPATAGEPSELAEVALALAAADEEEDALPGAFGCVFARRGAKKRAFF